VAIKQDFDAKRASGKSYIYITQGDNRNGTFNGNRKATLNFRMKNTDWILPRNGALLSYWSSTKDIRTQILSPRNAMLLLTKLSLQSQKNQRLYTGMEVNGII